MLKMEDHVVAAEYTNPEHTVIKYTTRNEGVHYCSKDSNPSFFVAIQRMAVIPNYSDGGSLRVSAPATPALPIRKPDALVIPPPQQTDLPVSAQSQPINQPATQASTPSSIDDEIARFIEIEVVAESAVIAMMDDEHVDQTKKATAIAYLSQEARIRGCALEDLCRALIDARDERNREVWNRRLARLKAQN